MSGERFVTYNDGTLMVAALVIAAYSDDMLDLRLLRDWDDPALDTVLLRVPKGALPGQWHEPV